MTSRSLYTQISKRLGLKHRTDVQIPRPEEVRATAARAMAGDAAAFEKLFKWNRFCPSPRTAAEVEANHLIYEAFHQSRVHFQKEPE